MSWDTTLSALGISAGALLMAVSILRFGALMGRASYIRSSEERGVLLRYLGVHRVLMVFFLVGYLVVLAGILTDVHGSFGWDDQSGLVLSEGRHIAHGGQLFVSLIFLFGAIFVLIGLQLQDRMIQGVIAEADQRLESQAALLELQEQLIATDRMVAMGTLAAGVAHEINNPLAYVIANRDLLASEWGREASSGPNSRVNRRLAVMEEGLERVRSIVADLNTYAKPETNADSNAPARLHDVLQAAIAIAGNAIRNRAVLHQEIDPNAIVQGNGRRLEQVFVNVLVNAAQSIPEGDSPNQRIEIITRVEGDTAIIEISDTGKGIPSEHLDRVFDPFYTTKPVGEGTGLGLAISQSIIANSGGSLSILSTVGEGTTVTTCLPIVSSRGAGAQHAVAAKDIDRPPFTARILVVDDEPAICELLVEILSEHEVGTASGGWEAINHLKEARCDLILCDVSMPEVSGLDVLDSIRAKHPDLEDRLIFLSGGSFTSNDLLATGQRPVLAKPFRREDVAHIVNQQLTALGPYRTEA